MSDKQFVDANHTDFLTSKDCSMNELTKSILSKVGKDSYNGII